LYTLRVTVYDANDQVIFLARRRIRVNSPAEVGRTVVNVYRSLVDRLTANDVSGALRSFTGDARGRYGNLIGALSGTPSQVAAQLGTLVDGVISLDAAELTLARDVAGTTQLFMIYLIRGRDGVWRIESM
jgi:hypothetical protein